jgi:hypothetical protein
MMPKKEKPGAMLAIALGLPKKGKSKRPMPMMGSKAPAEEEDEEDSDELPEDFVDYASSAFPELEGDEDRLRALKKAIEACSKSGY